MKYKLSMIKICNLPPFPKVLLLTVLIVLMIITPTLYIFNSVKTLIFSQEEAVAELSSSEKRVGIIFGAGITKDKEPNAILKDRLDLAGKLYNERIINEILLSGNNDEPYDEIDVMSAYLVDEFDIPTDALLYDGYGYRTYDTCKRASSYFGIDNAVLITTGYHLPRAIYLCENLGIESIGVSSTFNEYEGQNFYYFREMFANTKALIDTALIEPTVSESPYSFDLLDIEK